MIRDEPTAITVGVTPSNSFEPPSMSLDALQVGPDGELSVDEISEIIDQVHRDHRYAWLYARCQGRRGECPFHGSPGKHREHVYREIALTIRARLGMEKPS